MTNHQDEKSKVCCRQMQEKLKCGTDGDEKGEKMKMTLEKVAIALFLISCMDAIITRYRSEQGVFSGHS